MMFPKITLIGVEEAIAELDRREALVHENVEQGLAAWGQQATMQMIETHTFQNRTYRLEGSIGYDVHGWSGTGAQLAVFALANYSSQVEFGHPGPPPARPYPFFWPVFWNTEPDFWFQMRSAQAFGWDGLPWSWGSGSPLG
ncbi:hypothetical protein BH24ACT15_BH24ACT15_34840 [soil metagenome]